MIGEGRIVLEQKHQTDREPRLRHERQAQEAAQLAVLNGTRETCAQLHDVDGLRKVVRRAAPHRIHRRRDRGVARNHQDSRLRLEPRSFGQDLEAIDVVHHEVGEDCVVGCLAHARDSIPSGMGELTHATVTGQAVREGLRVPLVVVHDQNSHLRGGRLIDATHIPYASMSSGASVLADSPLRRSSDEPSGSADGSTDNASTTISPGPVGARDLHDQRERDGERSSAPGLRNRGDRAVVLLDDTLSRRESETRPAPSWWTNTARSSARGLLASCPRPCP